MSVLQDSFAKMRALTELGVRKSMAYANKSETIYARASLERAEIREDYYVEQEIARNSRHTRGVPSAGRVKLTMPYDGCDYFTRKALRDVAQAIETGKKTEKTAVIGHLLFKDYEKTTLGSDFQLAGRHGCVPIEIPIDRERVNGRIGAVDAYDVPCGLDHLISDGRTFVFRHEYALDSETPYILPARLDISLSDPDGLDLISPEDLTSESGRRRVGDVVEKIRQQANFQDDLILRVVLRVFIPLDPDVDGDLSPKIKRMAIQWPTISSLRTLRLRIGDRAASNATDTRYHDESVRYDPVHGRVVWNDIRMYKRARQEGDADVTRYESPVMLFSIQHPGEIYKGEILQTRANVEIPDYLLSGVKVRLYDATGHLSEKSRPQLKTHIHANARLRLDDAFATREFSPYQQLFFEGIVPDDMRIADIITAFRDRGFEISQIWSKDELERVNSSDIARWLLVAERQRGPDKMSLWIFVDGKHLRTRRETMVSGGVIHRTILNSGEIKVFIRGTLARESKELIREMNILQETLRERYDRVRQRR